jgi:acetylornithine/succinyldiaminopimelate/putrescine aminotransferase
MGCAAALATIEVMSEPGFMDNVKARGAQLKDAISELKERFPVLRQVRGPGLMVATSFEDPTRVPPVLDHCLTEGRLILMSAGTRGKVVRWMPPLVVTAAEIDEGVGIFAEALKATD